MNQPSSSSTHRGGPAMSRIVSFSVLVGILIAVGVLFFKVMAGFLLPLFLALLLVVMFRPLHRWFQRRFNGRRRLAAAATTVVILLAVLGPLFLVFWQATGEAMVVYRRMSGENLATKVLEPDAPAKEDVRSKEAAGLNVKLPPEVQQIFLNLGLDYTAEQVNAEIRKRFEEWLGPMLVVTTQYAIRLVIGLCIMLIAFYYFLVDGPAMMATVMRLSPLDAAYESQLVEEFDRTSRAVALATVVAAVVQGLLAGIGYYLADLEAVFLLMMLTMLLAMVPFVGAAAVWAPCAVWLLCSGHTMAAIVLALYGALVVSVIDNVIKPWILHGQSNLHPLLALLSVLGGVKALGPIGIFVGPMAVTFLYALLVMVQKELDRFGAEGPDKSLVIPHADK
jgi:predicted PurR-regulated permease PerM